MLCFIGMVGIDIGKMCRRICNSLQKLWWDLHLYFNHVQRYAGMALSWDHLLSYPVKFEYTGQDIAHAQDLLSKSTKSLNFRWKNTFDGTKSFICFVKSKLLKNALKSENFNIFWMMLDVQGATYMKDSTNQYSNDWTGYAVCMIWRNFAMSSTFPGHSQLRYSMVISHQQAASTMTSSWPTA